MWESAESEDDKEYYDVDKHIVVHGGWESESSFEGKQAEAYTQVVKCEQSGETIDERVSD